MSQSYKKLRTAFITQKHNAATRGIDFLLTFDQWLKIWVDSEHLQERGRKIGQYCMARFGDRGAYIVGNVKIILFGENVRESQIGNSHNVGKTLSEEHKTKIGNSVRGQKLPEFTEEHCLNISKARKELFETRRALGIPVQTEEVKNQHSAAMKIYWERVKQTGERKPPLVSEETRAKISVASKGRLQSEETRKKRSDTITAWHAERRLKKAVV